MYRVSNFLRSCLNRGTTSSCIVFQALNSSQNAFASTDLRPPRSLQSISRAAISIQQLQYSVGLINYHRPRSTFVVVLRAAAAFLTCSAPNMPRRRTMNSRRVQAFSSGSLFAALCALALALPTMDVVTAGLQGLKPRQFFARLLIKC